ncbi:MAG: hypothetical protein IJH34_13105 [Romboutsia sp.]|nr:hypothetical protein [Romboutsia sp.]
MANKIWDKFKPISKKSKDYDIKENLVKAPKIENDIQNKNETQLSSKVLNIKTKSNKADKKEINKANIHKNTDLESSYKNIENQCKDYRYIEESKKNEELIKKEKQLNIKESNLN